MTTVVDFETERAERRGRWTRWTDRLPASDLVFRVRGQLTLTGGGSPEPGSQFVRRTHVVCLIEAGGSLRAVRPPYDNLEWMPG